LPIFTKSLGGHGRGGYLASREKFLQHPVASPGWDMAMGVTVLAAQAASARTQPNNNKRCGNPPATPSPLQRQPDLTQKATTSIVK